ncbi:uncharacterized protein LOC104874790 [Fukomys damarensis]|uniref:uncharacterized protein LOC104874790 n=1 Tax=Fukomys damarensis TaxID=885580 RepID=UPI00053FD11F|nr:uncharacterized protein LOC104874790 [Fukomys damarensis]
MGRIEPQRANVAVLEVPCAPTRWRQPPPQKAGGRAPSRRLLHSLPDGLACSPSALRALRRGVRGSGAPASDRKARRSGPSTAPGAGRVPATNKSGTNAARLNAFCGDSAFHSHRILLGNRARESADCAGSHKQTATGPVPDRGCDSRARAPASLHTHSVSPRGQRPCGFHPTSAWEAALPSLIGQLEKAARWGHSLTCGSPKAGVSVLSAGAHSVREAPILGPGGRLLRLGPAGHRGPPHGSVTVEDGTRCIQSHSHRVQNKARGKRHTAQDLGGKVAAAPRMLCKQLTENK